MMSWIKEISPIVGIGLFFGIAYELVLWLAIKLDQSKPKKKEKIVIIKPFSDRKEEKNIA